ncbi:hypothetical protein NE237_029043 [Protea cynaroides]|uniref:C2H2-type domain-containing protein n=1 Tax=Protea cynaroides TaxID=273540 RepID=A0A9Q0GSE5_9MAGN|nr:hypothetical protein NE237_029043 [Protea cynaroides]
MPATKLRTCSTPDAMMSDQKGGKSEEVNDPIDNLIRHAIGKEPFLSFSRAGDSPVQWIQLLHALDQQDLPGWPLLSPSKVQMQKCEKCSREFCSPINYRRHMRVHRRSLNIDKDSPKNREVLGAFWDKLSLDDAKEIVSFNNVMLEEVPGSSIIRALTSIVRKPGFSLLSQVHIKAGAALLDVVQGRPSRFPLSSHELFSILDDASEKTFLCAGTAISMQKFVFDGEAAKIGLEMKNLVACTSFLVEQKLVTAWLADKDAEALRCQKLLVEEEEAARTRQAELLERRRLKKLRQKEHKSSEQTDGDKEDSKDGSPDALDDVVSPTDKTSPEVTPDLLSLEGKLGHVSSFLEPVRHLKTDVETDTGGQTGFRGQDIEMASGNMSLDNCQNVDPRMQQGGGLRQPILAQRQLPKSQRGMPNGLHSGQNALKLGAVQKHGSYKEQRTTSMAIANGHKVWTRKTKPEAEGEGLNSNIQGELVDQSDQNAYCELLIGSISVTVGDCGTQCQGDTVVAALDQCMTEYEPPRQNYILGKPIKPESGHEGTNQMMVKLWRPVGRHEVCGSTHVQGDKREDEVNVISGQCTDQTLSSESCLGHGPMDDNSSSRRDSPFLLEDNAGSRGLKFSHHSAKAFLSQRWKDAISTDHVKLVLCSENEPPGCLDNHDDVLASSQFPSDSCKRSILGNAENWLVGVGTLDPCTTGAAKSKFGGKPDKGCRLKYIPKKRDCT